MRRKDTSTATHRTGRSPLLVDDPPHALAAEVVGSATRVEVRPPQLLNGCLDGEPLSTETLEALAHTNIPERRVQRPRYPLVGERQVQVLGVVVPVHHDLIHLLHHHE